MSDDQAFPFLKLPVELQLNCLEWLDGSSVVSRKGTLLSKYGELSDFRQVSKACRKLAIQASTGCSIVIGDLAALMLGEKASSSELTRDSAIRFKNSAENRAGTLILARPTGWSTLGDWWRMINATLTVLISWSQDDDTSRDLLPHLHSVCGSDLYIDVSHWRSIPIGSDSSCLTTDFKLLPELVNTLLTKRALKIVFSCSSLSMPEHKLILPNVTWTNSGLGAHFSLEEGAPSDISMDHTVEIDCSGIARRPAQQSQSRLLLGVRSIVRGHSKLMNGSSAEQPSTTTLHFTLDDTDAGSLAWLKDHEQEITNEIAAWTPEGFRHHFEVSFGGKKHDWGYKVVDL